MFKSNPLHVGKKIAALFEIFLFFCRTLIQPSVSRESLLERGFPRRQIIIFSVELQQNAAPQGHHHPGTGLGEAGRKGLAAQVVLFTDQATLRLDLAKPQGRKRGATGRIGRLG